MGGEGGSVGALGGVEGRASSEASSVVDWTTSNGDSTLMESMGSTAQQRKSNKGGVD